MPAYKVEFIMNVGCDGIEETVKKGIQKLLAGEIDCRTAPMSQATIKSVTVKEITS